MRELLRSNDLVLLSYAGHLLNEFGVDHLIFDAHTSAVEGSLGVLPRRLMVSEDDYNKARRVLQDASVSLPAS